MPIKKILIIVFITMITISPYLVRNYLVFEKIIIHSSFGFNLWKGNNQNSKIEGSFIIPKTLQDKIDKIPIKITLRTASSIKLSCLNLLI